MKHTSRYLIFSLALILIGTLVAVSTRPVSAHGKEVEITVTSLVPDSAQPLTRLYRVVVLYDDGDTVEGASIELLARREEGGQEIGPINFYPLSEPGLYATEVAYDRFGTWEVTVVVSEPGEGEASFEDAILPGSGDVATTENATSSAVPENLAVLFKFDESDFLNIVLRFVHSLAGMVWFGLIGVILVSHWFMAPEARHRALLRLRKIFPQAATVSLTILLASGIYSAIWDAPIRAPGVFDLDTMLRIPFGDVYLITFLGKVLAYVLLVYVTVRLRRALSDLPTSSMALGSSGPGEILTIARLGMAGLGAAVFLAINIAALIYMHYISHLSIVIPQ